MLSSRPRSFFSALSRISAPLEQSQTGTMDDFPSSGIVNLITFLLISSKDGVCDEGVLGRLTRNVEPEFDVGGEGVLAIFL